MNITMKHLNLFSFIALIVLFTSCHSTEVSLRGSKVQELAHPKQDIQTESNTFTNSQQEKTAPLTTESTPFQAVFPSIELSKPSVLTDRNTKTSQKSANTQTVHTSSNTAVINSVKPKINPQFHQPKSNTTANNNHRAHSKGFFGSVGHSFGVVGVVFIFVGLILFLIGGLLIDTLGALFVGFGLVFLLIWLVLAVLQGLFDVIL
jgi:hypothetical protein